MAKGMCDLHKNFPHSEPFFAFYLPVSDLYQAVVYRTAGAPALISFPLLSGHLNCGLAGL
jgi:hypothetical protein